MRTIIPTRLRPIVATVVGIAIGSEALPMPLWGRMLLVGLTALAAAEGITPSSTATVSTRQAIKQEGPWT